MSIAKKLSRRCPALEISWLLLAFCTLISLTGCATKNNGFTQFYQDKVGAGISNLPPYSGTTRILTSSNTVSDAKDLYRHGYTLLGDSEFQGPWTSESALKLQAKQVGADVVLRSSTYLGNAAPATPWPSSMNSGGMFTSPTGPNSVRMYEYKVGFFRMGRPGILGLSDRPVPPEIRQKLALTTGVSVDVVVNDSPAFSAKILEGDVILKLNGEDVTSDSGLREKLNQLAGQKVELEIWRTGEIKTIPVQLNPNH